MQQPTSDHQLPHHDDQDFKYNSTNTLEILPSELLMEIFTYCSFGDVYSISLVSRNFNSLVGWKKDEPSPEQEDNSIFSMKYYHETRKRMEKLLAPEVIYTDDSEEVIHSKIHSLLFDWMGLVAGRNEKLSCLEPFAELEKDLRFIGPTDEFDWKYFTELTEKLNSISICGEKKWYGFTLLDKRGERIPIFCRLSQQYDSASREMNFIILALFDSNGNITGNLQEVCSIKEALFYYEYLGFDSMSSFSGYEWILENFTRYIHNPDTELALFGSALEFYITNLKSRKFSKTSSFPRIKQDLEDYYFNNSMEVMLCFNSLHCGVNVWYSHTRLHFDLHSIIYKVKRFYSHHKKLLSDDENSQTGSSN